MEILKRTQFCSETNHDLNCMLQTYPVAVVTL